jgi:hypothetical protein
MPDPARPTLGELQAQLFALVTRRSPPLNRGTRQRAAAAEGMARIIRSQAGMDAAARVAVYANMYFHRLLDVLRADFPKLASVLGDAAFGRLAADYLRKFPPVHPSVRHAGRALAEFVRRHPVAARRRWVADLARLEWLRLDVHDRADDEPLDPAELRRLAPDALAAKPLRLVAAHAILRSGFAVDQVWRRIEAGGRAVSAARGPRWILVWRRGDVVWHRAMPADEARLLRRVVAGTTFAALCEDLGRKLPAQKAARRAAELLSLWTAEALLTRR